MSDLFGWAAVSVYVAVLIGMGVGLLGMSPPQYALARLSFTVGALVLIPKVAYWLAGLQGSAIARSVVGVGIFTAIGLGWVETLRWLNSLEGNSQQVAQPVPVNDAVAQLARQMADANRPWLFIVSESVDPATGRIQLVVQNKGRTPAYDVKVEHWGEVSKVIPRPKAVPVDQLPPDFEKNLELMKFFDKEYDTRQTVLPNFGAQGASMRMPMLLPNQTFDYDLTDPIPDLVKRLDLKPPRYTRLAGRITYTDQRKELKPDFQFCYQILALRDKKGEIQKRPLRCPDQDLNQSR